MTVLRYPLSALFTDYAIGLSGTAICAVMLVTSGWPSKLFWLFLALTLCCLAYTMRTVLQHRTVFQVDENGISRTLFGAVRRIDWNSLGGMSLRYYPRRRPKKKGFGSVLGRIGRRGFDDRDNRSDRDNRPPSPLSDGWLVLNLRDRAKNRISIESGLPQFFALTERAASAARRNGVEIDPISDDNLRALASLPPELRTAAAPQAFPGVPVPDVPVTGAPRATDPTAGAQAPHPTTRRNT
ncbi:MAG TPA: hypothetical protein VM639_06765 [Dongiaceae bacterium]|nr:hypothetical protein [Dongiaceae bacterium]